MKLFQFYAFLAAWTAWAPPLDGCVRLRRLGSAPELKDLSQIRSVDKMLIVTTMVSFIKDNYCLSYLLW